MIHVSTGNYRSTFPGVSVGPFLKRVIINLSRDFNNGIESSLAFALKCLKVLLYRLNLIVSNPLNQIEIDMTHFEYSVYNCLYKLRIPSVARTNSMTLSPNHYYKKANFPPLNLIFSQAFLMPTLGTVSLHLAYRYSKDTASLHIPYRYSKDTESLHIAYRYSKDTESLHIAHSAQL